MPTFIKVILKLYATMCLLNGINYGMAHPGKSGEAFILSVFFGWLIWKMWKKKEIKEVKAVPSCAHCGGIKA